MALGDGPVVLLVGVPPDDVDDLVRRMTSLLPLGRQLEQLAGLGILAVSVTLLGLSLLAWRRERDRKMAIVAVAYGFFARHGLVGTLEYVLL